jgi:hypothetical protein
MWWHVGCEALQAGKRLRVTYDGYSRIVEVHAVGTSRDDNPLMRVWQCSGGSVSNEPIGWKLMRLDKTWSFVIMDERSEVIRR